MQADSLTGPALFSLTTLASPQVDMILAEDAGFEIELTQRECASPSNTVSLLSPTSETLSTTMCQEPVNRTWSYPTVHPTGTTITLDFLSGFTGEPGELALYGEYPAWVISAEDGYDEDFNDFTLACSALVSCQLLDQPPATALLDEIAVKYLLRRLANDSGLFGPADNRREHLAYIVQRGNAIYTVDAQLRTPLSSCMARPVPGARDPIDNDPNAILRAEVHTHPFPGGQEYPAPAECWTVGSSGELVLMPAGQLMYIPPGPSIEDWQAWEGFTEMPYEGWVLDAEAVWRWYQTGGPSVFDVVFDSHDLYNGVEACVG